MLRTCPVFKVEAQHLVMFMFTESGVVFLWVRMTVICCWVERVQVEKGGGSVRRIAVVWGRPGSTVSREIGLEQVGVVEPERVIPPVPGCSVTHLVRWPQRSTGQSTDVVSSIELPPATCVCAGSDGWGG